MSPHICVQTEKQHDFNKWFSYRQSEDHHWNSYANEAKDWTEWRQPDPIQSTKHRKFGKQKNAICEMNHDKHNLSATHRDILLNQSEIRLYLPFPDWFGYKGKSVWFQINQKMVNTIWFRVDLIRYRKDFSVCMTMMA